MCFGGGGDDSSSREMIAMQKEEAKKAAKKEAERQARIKGGLAKITNIFEGNPIMKKTTEKYDWGKFKPPTGSGSSTAKIMGNLFGKSAADAVKKTEGTPTAGSAVPGLPKGFTYVMTPGKAIANPVSQAVAPGGNRVPMGSGNVHGQRSEGQSFGGGSVHGQRYDAQPQPAQTAAGGRGPATWQIRGPDGKIYNVGQDISYEVNKDTGKRAGWQDKFYSDYGNAMNRFYLTDVAKQYGKAQEETLYRLARAGTTKSNAATATQADLATQNIGRQGDVRSKTDEAVGSLKDRVAKEKAAAESQLYATENPDVASRQALGAVQNISAEKPTLSPLGEIFNIATIGAANMLGGASNARRMQNIPGVRGYGQTSVVGS